MNILSFHWHYGPLAASGFDWTVLVAIGTLALAAGTAWLASSTHQLAAASTADQQAQWRPILTVDADGGVDYDDTAGELSFDLRNVGRGPAFGITAELRSGTLSIGSSTPGLGATALAPGDSFRLHTRVSEPNRAIRGKAVTIEVSYYDVTEYWHKSHLTMTGRRPPDKLQDDSVRPELKIEKVFFSRANERLLPVTGSPRAKEEERLASEPWAKRQWRRLRTTFGG